MKVEVVTIVFIKSRHEIYSDSDESDLQIYIEFKINFNITWSFQFVSKG
jgi:hypothetical protein